MKYTIPAIPPSLNRFAGRKNVHEYRKLKTQWTQIVALLCKKVVGMPYNRATVRITYFFPNRIRRDPDNYAGKLILDGLTAAGVIQDDSFRHIELVLRGEYDKKSPRTEIEVTEHEKN